MIKVGLLEKIEECREKMILLSDNNDLHSNVVIESSMELDELINEYLKISHHHTTTPRIYTTN